MMRSKEKIYIQIARDFVRDKKLGIMECNFSLCEQDGSPENLLLQEQERVLDLLHSPLKILERDIARHLALS